jgi:hypothetical protein
MERKIRIKIDSLEWVGTLNDSKTAGEIWDALPIEVGGNLWGKEIYFTTSLNLAPEDPHEVVEPGTLAYWPQGSGFCIFWGPTPVSQGKECRPYSPVNVFGRLEGDLSLLDTVKAQHVLVEKIQD